MEGKDNDLGEAENVTDEEGAEDTVDRVELFLLTRGAASTRRSCAVQRSVVLVVTLGSWSGISPEEVQPVMTGEDC